MMTEDKEGLNNEAEKPPIDAVIFDLDGVLIDSELAWNKAFIRFLNAKNISLPPDVSSKLEGMGIREIIEQIEKHEGIQGDTQRLMEEYRNVFYEIFFESGNFLKEGAKEILAQLDGKYRLALATGGHNREMALKILSNSGIADYFEAVFSSDDVRKGKPAPDVYLETAKKLGIEPKSCVVIEDSVNGVLSAKAAGMRVIGIDERGYSRHKLYSAHADRVYPGLSAVNFEELQ